ncbi:MAG: 1-acyl-sn-glycerol-3-phosphate acyltransferase [Candidatus Dactylopiibacterium carminicum]|uniref:1-acyl-sn-glycerol-3-phosphate acyltransferase n=1 Tax=Candidatus Dactylopiibacterium carminicum TaxID=857335 RepID=A0A272EQ19_9RHOO|nr:lysophospholipid acyltransferase family protein [Candidatus Dactylopiibacterium carminicum]KAF7598466.1 1-acyl-sn-glycerol-3-phosphate acyltransferase [Candidatus Dactylopiibacterium carminicum]PAS92204.1 MAG: 1-acyl-sn-glycerol-3-phosphate acyltransferase [Candidatus Dactylopiibacterium carminicum]PAS97784.1 MAG: 1-acyl-sn-glycerol-3-phosphate acyltransferase [Candidatus Dactylopiibacterium carminicum]
MVSVLHPLRRLHAFLAMHTGYVVLGAGCLLWSTVTLPLTLVLHERHGTWLGRWVACLGFRSYLAFLTWIGVARFDLKALDALRGDGAMIVAPNHPGLLDALMVISRLPGVACVQKASLLDNPLWGAGSRLAGYIRNDWFIGSITLAVQELRRGGQLLLFPEGTRSEGPLALGTFRAGAAYVAHRAQVPLQTVIIEQDTCFLGKGWPLSRVPKMPMHFRVRLGERFAPPDDPEAFTRELYAYFARELVAGAPSPESDSPCPPPVTSS